MELFPDSPSISFLHLKSMALEIERKFLISKETFNELKKTNSSKFIQQGYLIIEKGFHTRIRIVDNKQASITTKIGSGMSREELEDSISLEQGLELLRKCSVSLKKERISVEHQGYIWDIDYFIDHEIFTAEIELSSESETFPIPSWIKEEITGNKKYSNTRLAR